MQAEGVCKCELPKSIPNFDAVSQFTISFLGLPNIYLKICRADMPLKHTYPESNNIGFGDVLGA